MNCTDIILIGAGGHARACIDVIEDAGHFRIVGLVGLPEELGIDYFGHRVIGSDATLGELRSRCQHALVTVGHMETPYLREQLYHRAVELGFELPPIVARDAIVSRFAAIGSGTIVMHGAVVNAGAAVGVNCIVNTRALVEHDALVQDHCHISTAAVLNGGVRVGSGSFIGSGSVIKEGISVGTRCLIGMGCSVRHNRPDNSRYTGGPADA